MIFSKQEGLTKTFSSECYVMCSGESVDHVLLWETFFIPVSSSECCPIQFELCR